MRFVFIIIILSFYGILFSYSQAIFVQGKNYVGYVFPKEYEEFPGALGEKNNYYTPSAEDIAQAENWLHNNVDNIFSNDNQYLYFDDLINKRSLKKYIRQYRGYLANDNRKMLEIIFVHKNLKIKTERFLKNLITIYDGGSFYWWLLLDLTNNKIDDVHINGDS